MEELYMVVKATNNAKIFETVELNLPHIRAYEIANSYNERKNTTEYSIIKQKKGRINID